MNKSETESECEVIYFRKDVVQKFNAIMEETHLDANQLMEHLFTLHNCTKINGPQFTQNKSRDQLKTIFKEEPVPRPTLLLQEVNYSNEMSHLNSQDSSINDADKFQHPEDKINRLQRLRRLSKQGRSNETSLNASSYQGYDAFTGMPSPSMVPKPNAAVNFLPTLLPKKGKKANKIELSQIEANSSLIEDGEDLLNSSMCSVCQAVFPRFTDLLAHHKAVHSSDTNHPLRCGACGRIETSEAGLIYHQVYVCKQISRPHPCHICGLKFQTEELVLVHKCSGDPRKKYACEFCDNYRSESANDMVKHLRIHTGDKCYVCRVCGFSTAWKKNLKDHMVKHLGLKPYSCEVCDYSTADRHSLRAHRIKHYERGEGCLSCGPTECKCKPYGGGGDAGRKRKLSSVDVSSDIVASPSSDKEFVCPYTQCAYSTKFDYMMTSHIMQHQAVEDVESAGSSRGASSYVNNVVGSSSTPTKCTASSSLSSSSAAVMRLEPNSEGEIQQAVTYTTTSSTSPVRLSPASISNSYNQAWQPTMSSAKFTPVSVESIATNSNSYNQAWQATLSSTSPTKLTPTSVRSIAANSSSYNQAWQPTSSGQSVSAMGSGGMVSPLAHFSPLVATSQSETMMHQAMTKTSLNMHNQFGQRMNSPGVSTGHGTSNQSMPVFPTMSSK